MKKDMMNREFFTRLRALLLYFAVFVGILLLAGVILVYFGIDPAPFYQALGVFLQLVVGTMRGGQSTP